jgi:hypothetical protein
MRNWLRRTAVVITLVATPGCARETMAPVKGRVMFNGKPVKEAQVTFAPAPRTAGDKEPGKAATGFTNNDGVFVLSTYKAYDGALIGMHHVTISLDDTNPARCKRLQQFEREVKPGDNQLEIELQP